MAIEYHAVEKKVIGGPDKGQKKFYAVAKNTGTTTLEMLQEEIESSSTVNGADIAAVLYALKESIPRHLEAGNTVDLGGLGSFHISLSSRGEDTAAKVSSKSIKSAKIIFAPGKKLKPDVKHLVFKKI
ncbi:MAG: HU family DNA-binding protein [Spirochaetota bacterium]